MVVRPLADGGVDVSPLGRIFGDLSTAMWELLSGFDLDQQLVIHRYLTGTIEVLREQTRRLGSAVDDAPNP